MADMYRNAEPTPIRPPEWLSWSPESDGGADGSTHVPPVRGEGMPDFQPLRFRRGLPSHWDETSDRAHIFSEMLRLARIVYYEGACALPGVSIKYQPFMEIMHYACHRGTVSLPHAAYVARMLRWGADAGIVLSRLAGIRLKKNYPGADGAFKGQLADALTKRITKHKSLDLGVWRENWAGGLREVFGSAFIAPLNAREKPLEPGVCRPITDHTVTGLNEAADLTFLRHRLDTYNDIARQLKPGFLMHVSDIDSAFPLLPLTPALWPYMLVRFLLRNTQSEGGELTAQQHLVATICGDFGTAGMPGSFKIFYVDVLLNMARAMEILTLPMETWVDDSGLIGAFAREVSEQMAALQAWAEERLGVSFKRLKDRAGAEVQHMLGFWWDSFSRTRSLDVTRLTSYMDMLLDYSMRRSLTLHERQTAIGRMQRAVMTMPPGAGCLLASSYSLLSGLSRPWQRRRTTAAERADYSFFRDVLDLNLGQGYFSFDQFVTGPTLLTDASKSGGRGYCGGGWVSSDGAYDWFEYGSKSRRHPIDYLEGDVVVCAVEALMSQWKGKVVTIGIDNAAFERSAERSWSRAERLNNLLKRLFLLQIQGDFLLRYFWLSSGDNYLADHLSRNRLSNFLAAVVASGFLILGVYAVRPHRQYSGGVRTFQRLTPEDQASLLAMAQAPRPQLDMNHYSKSVRAAVKIQAAWKGFRTRRYFTRREELFRVEHPEIDPSTTAYDNDSGYHYYQRRERGPIRGGGDGRPTRWFIFLLCLATPTAGAPLSVMGLTVQYPRCSLYHGMDAHTVERVDQLLDNRLSASSMQTVRRGYDIWVEVADAKGWPHLIETDDEERGNKMVCFVLHMLDHCIDLAYDSINNYVWGLRWWMKLQRMADPVMGVMNWEDFMKSVKVVAWVPHEPRRAIPLPLIKAMLQRVDVHSFWEVNWALMTVILLFTFSRVECPCPHAFTGPQSFDRSKHWMVRDICIRWLNNVGYVLGVRFKAIKQDPRIERPAARGDGTQRAGEASRGGADWAFVGDVPGSVFSPFTWYRRHLSFLHARDPTDPFFLARDMARPYTYPAFMSDLKTMLLRVGDDDAYGAHGLRVTGYNCSVAAAGEAITVAQGGWQSDAHHRYARFELGDVASLAAHMVNEQSPYDSAPRERRVERRTDPQPLSRGQGLGALGRSPPVPENPPLEPENPWAASDDEHGAEVSDRVTRQTPTRAVVVAAARAGEEGSSGVRQEQEEVIAPMQSGARDLPRAVVGVAVVRGRPRTRARSAGASSDA